MGSPQGAGVSFHGAQECCESYPPAVKGEPAANEIHTLARGWHCGCFQERAEQFEEKKKKKPNNFQMAITAVLSNPAGNIRKC